MMRLFSLPTAGAVIDRRTASDTARVDRSKIGNVWDQFGQIPELCWQQMIEVVFTIATTRNETRQFHQGQVVTDRGLAVPQPSTEAANIEFSFFVQKHNDPQTCLVRENLEQLSQFANRCRTWRCRGLR